MKHKINTILIPAIFIILFACCKKKDTTPKLPDATQTGANTFGCKVNGELAYTNRYMPSLIGIEGVEYSLSPNGRVNLSCITKNPRRDFWIVFQLDDLTSILGTHNANKYVLSGYSTLDLSNGGTLFGSAYYVANDSLPATVTITKFSGKVSKGAVAGDIFSGTFDIQMRNANGTIAHLTEGRFDITKQ
jgi:hypothetical protein